MDRIRSSAEGQSVLAGSLVAFPLLDVLALLDKTGHVGELKVVKEGSDDHFFVDAGDLIDPSGGATGRLFALACAGDAWFAVTADAGLRPPGARVALRTVIDHLGPRLAEWDDLRRSVPLDATARMAPSTSLPEVHLRADQWRVLSRLGGGRRVGDLVDEAEGSPVDTLRVMRELADAGLVSLGPATAALPASRRTRTVMETSGPPPRRGGARDGAPNGASGVGASDSGGDRGAHASAGSDAPPEPDNGSAPSPRPTRAGDRSERASRRGAEPSPAAEPRRPTALMPAPLATRPWATAPGGR